MTAEEVGETSLAETDARMLADLREWRRSPSVVAKLAEGREVWLTGDEIDMLLRVADERDRLKREGCMMPDEMRGPIGALPEHPTTLREIPPGYALVGGELVELPQPSPMHRCVVCDGAIMMTAGQWFHVGVSGLHHRAVPRA